MTFIEKLKYKQTLPNTIYFFKEGCFCRLYNEDLFWFCNEVKLIKAIFKHLKKENLDLVYGGFPIVVLPTLKKQFPAFFDTAVNTEHGFYIETNSNALKYSDCFNKKKKNAVFLLSLKTQEQEQMVRTDGKDSPERITHAQAGIASP